MALSGVAGFTVIRSVRAIHVKKGFKEETGIGSHSHLIIYFTFLFFSVFSVIAVLFLNGKGYEIINVLFLIRLLILFYILPFFIKDIQRITQKTPPAFINFIPFMLLFPFYLGVWANDRIIIKVLYLAISGLITLRLDLKFFHRFILFIGFALFVLLFPFNQIFSPLCILLSVLLMLQFKKDTANNFMLFILTGFAIIKLLRASSAVFFNVFNGFSFFVSKASSIHIAGGSALGLSLSGYELFFSLFAVTTVYLFIKKNIRIVYPFVIFSFVYSLYLQIFPLLLEYDPSFALNIRFVLPLLLSLLLFFNETYFIALEDAEEPKRKELNRKYSIIYVIITFILLCIIFFNPIFVDNKKMQKSIAIVSSSQKTADLTPITNSDSIGFAYSPYIYGSIQMYLELFGYKTKIFYGLENVPLSEFDGLLLVHYNTPSDNLLKEKIKDFVYAGGSVFAVSDHTNIFNSMEKTNELLSFSAISIQDDISDSLMHYSGKVWQNSLDYFTSFATHHIETENDVGVWGGASVKTNNIFAKPLVIAQYGLSDPGDHSAIGEINSFMRNRKFDVGEAAGDIPLVFNTAFGKGTVTVFGDASYFQIPVLMYNWNFIAKLLYETLYSNHNTAQLILSIVQLIIVVLVVISLIFINKKWKVGYINKIILLSLMLSACIMRLFNFIGYTNNEKTMLQQFSNNFVYIDTAHKNFYSTDMLAKNEISGIGYNAMKLCIPVICSNKNSLREISKFAILINPRTQITKADIAMLDKYMQNGGTVLLFCGKEFNIYVKQFLEYYDLSFSNDFLGPLPWKNVNIPITQTIPGAEFKEAWNILYRADNTVPYYSYQGMVPVTKTKVKNGFLYFIADSRFISANNIEGEMGGNKQNIEFIQNIYKEGKINE